MNNCPCCSNRLLRQTRGRDIYWFCLHCWQEMPLLDRAARTKHMLGTNTPAANPTGKSLGCATQKKAQMVAFTE